VTMITSVLEYAVARSSILPHPHLISEWGSDAMPGR